MNDAAAPKDRSTPARTAEPDSPRSPTAAPDNTARPGPDMASLMLELARIRQEVEGMSEPKKRLGSRGWLVVAVLSAALLWWMMKGFQ